MNRTRPQDCTSTAHRHMQPLATRLAQSNFTQDSHFNIQACLSNPFPQTPLCCKFTPSTSSSTTNMPPTDLTLSAAKSTSPDLKEDRYTKLRQESPDNLHSPPTKGMRIGYVTSPHSKGLQQQEQTASQQRAQQPQVSLLNSTNGQPQPKHEQHRPGTSEHRPTSESPSPSHRKKHIDQHIVKNVDPSTTRNTNEAPAELHKSQLQVGYRSQERTEVRLLQRPLTQRNQKTKHMEQQPSSTKPTRLKPLNTQHIHSKNTTSGTRNLHENGSRQRNPNSLTAMPPNTSKHDKKHRIAAGEIPQDKRKPQLPSSTHHCSLLSTPPSPLTSHGSDSIAPSVPSESNSTTTAPCLHLVLRFPHSSRNLAAASQSNSNTNRCRVDSSCDLGRSTTQQTVTRAPAETNTRRHRESGDYNHTPTACLTNRSGSVLETTYAQHTTHRDRGANTYRTSTTDADTTHWTSKTVCKLQKTIDHHTKHQARDTSTCRNLTSDDTTIIESGQSHRRPQAAAHWTPPSRSNSRPGATSNIAPHKSTLPNRGGQSTDNATPYTGKSAAESLPLGESQQLQYPNIRPALWFFTSATEVTRPIHPVTLDQTPPATFDNHTVCNYKALLCSPKPFQQLQDTNQPSKYSPNCSLFKQAFPSTLQKTLTTLSNQSIPYHVWETYASRRDVALISKALAPLTKHSCKPTTREYQLLDVLNSLNKKIQPHLTIVYSNHSCLQLLPKTMIGAAKPHTRHHNSNHTNEVVMEEVTPPSKRTSPNPSKASQKKSKSNSSIISLYRDPSEMEFWYGYPIMETIAYEAGMPPIPISTSLEELIATGYVASEAAELCSACISFPRVQQKLWPTTRPDGIEGQHINITQLLFDIEVNPKTNLSLNYHIMLHFEKPNHPFSQDQVMKKIVDEISNYGHSTRRPHRETYCGVMSWTQNC